MCIVVQSLGLVKAQIDPGYDADGYDLYRRVGQAGALLSESPRLADEWIMNLLRSPTEPRYGSFRCTDEVGAVWRATLKVAQALRATAIAFQCLGILHSTPTHVRNLSAFFSVAAKQAAGLRLCWEPRGDWPRHTLLELCEELGVALVVDLFRREPHAPGWRYFRLHRIGDCRYNYSERDLRRLIEWCDGEVYCLFNNMTMANDAQRFQKLLQHARTE